MLNLSLMYLLNFEQLLFIHLQFFDGFIQTFFVFHVFPVSFLPVFQFFILPLDMPFQLIELPLYTIDFPDFLSYTFMQLIVFLYHIRVLSNNFDVHCYHIKVKFCLKDTDFFMLLGKLFVQTVDN